MVLDGDVWVSPTMIPELCELAGVDRTTVARWLKRRRLPLAVWRLLRLVQRGELGDISPAWRGWILHPRVHLLFTPNEMSRAARRGLAPEQLIALPWQLALLAELRAAAREQHHNDAALLDQPAPLRQNTGN